MNDYPNQNIQYFYRNQISQKGYPLRHEYYPVAPDEIYVYIMFVIANYAKVKKKKMPAKLWWEHAALMVVQVQLLYRDL